jgi:hypothetical protein
MRSEPPHRLIRFRGLLLVVALVAWVIFAAVLLAWKYDPPMPQYANALWAAAAIAFLWFNGAFWWLELRYPHIEVATGTYVSRTEQSSRFAQTYSSLIFLAYGVGALLGTISVLRLVAGG